MDQETRTRWQMFLGPSCGPEILSPTKSPEFLVEKVSARRYTGNTPPYFWECQGENFGCQSRKQGCLADSTKVTAGAAVTTYGALGVSQRHGNHNKQNRILEAMFRSSCSHSGQKNAVVTWEPLLL